MEDLLEGEHWWLFKKHVHLIGKFGVCFFLREYWMVWCTFGTFGANCDGYGVSLGFSLAVDV